MTLILSRIESLHQTRGETVSGVELGFAHLRTGLLVSFGALVVALPFLSYAMARHALGPLKVSYDAQRRFVDDASHEFRTPLSILQAEMELALSRPRSSAEYVLCWRERSTRSGASRR